MEFELILLVGCAMSCFGAYCVVQSVCRRGMRRDESNDILALKLELSESKQRIMELEKQIETLRRQQDSQHGSTPVILNEIYITNSMGHFHSRSDCGSLKGNSWKKVQLCAFCSKKEAKKLL